MNKILFHVAQLDIKANWPQKRVASFRFCTYHTIKNRIKLMLTVCSIHKLSFMSVCLIILEWASLKTDVAHDDFTWGYAHHEIVGSVGYTRWLGVWRVFIALFCSALAAMLGKRGLFADGQIEWYSMVKLKARWFRCLQHLNLMYYSRPACRASGACLRTAFQLVLVSWYSILQSCVADLPTYYCSNAWYGDY